MSTEYFSVVYDIRRPFDKYYNHLVQKAKAGSLSPAEAAELKRRRKQNTLIESFVAELQNYGVRINWSVFVFPSKFRDRVEEVLDRYKAKFDQLGISYDIYILEYAPSSNPIIQDKVLLHLKLTVERVVKKLREAKTSGERRAYNEELRHLVDLATVFGLEDKLKKYIDEKLKEVGVLSIQTIGGGNVGES